LVVAWPLEGEKVVLIPTKVGKRRSTYSKTAQLSQKLDDGTVKLSENQLQEKFAELGALCQGSKATGVAIDPFAELFKSFEANMLSGLGSSSSGASGTHPCPYTLPCVSSSQVCVHVVVDSLSKLLVFTICFACAVFVLGVQVSTPLFD
jgi:hypothetical protein